MLIRGGSIILELGSTASAIDNGISYRPMYSQAKK
jgi:hypothetical protein